VFVFIKFILETPPIQAYGVCVCVCVWNVEFGGGVSSSSSSYFSSFFISCTSAVSATGITGIFLSPRINNQRPHLVFLFIYLLLLLLFIYFLKKKKEKADLQSVVRLHLLICAHAPG